MANVIKQRTPMMLFFQNKTSTPWPHFLLKYIKKTNDILLPATTQKRRSI